MADVFEESRQKRVASPRVLQPPLFITRDLALWISLRSSSPSLLTPLRTANIIGHVWIYSILYIPA